MRNIYQKGITEIIDVLISDLNSNFDFFFEYFLINFQFIEKIFFVQSLAETVKQSGNSSPSRSVFDN